MCLLVVMFLVLGLVGCVMQDLFQGDRGTPRVDGTN